MAGANFGVIGLGVMGRNLALNAERRGFTVAVFNRSTERTEEFVAGCPDRRFVPSYSLPEFVRAIERPRTVLLMIRAGPATDAVLSDLLPLLERGDVLIDGGNAHPEETDRRQAKVSEHDVHYLGAGISGGASGALHGPSIMVGGTDEAYAIAGPILETIAAEGPAGVCCAHLGVGSAGHYVKMVHNGIEYAIMQALAEAYDLMRRGLGFSADEAADAFEAWNRRELAGYLVEITGRILRRIDPEAGVPLVERILDTAAQKGTGKWSSQSALDLGSPAPTLAAAVYARILSSLRDERIAAEVLLEGPVPKNENHLNPETLYSATLLTVIGALAEGFRQLRDASDEHGYSLDLAEAARVWMAGCIIRSDLLAPIREVFLETPGCRFLLAAEPFRTIWTEHQAGFRETVAWAQQNGIPIPAMSSALNAFDAYRTGRLPANLIQAQRDYFGAHTYERIDREGTFHTEWEDA